MVVNPISHRDINPPLGDLRPPKKRGGGAGSTDLIGKNHRGLNGRGGSNVPMTDARQYNEMK